MAKFRDRFLTACLAFLGATLAIGVVAGLAHFTRSAWIIPPFGSTCAILFGVPKARFAQPKRVVGGHLLAMSCGIAGFKVWGTAWWGLALAVGLAIGLMLLFDVFHPPAGANPLLALAMPLDWPMLLMPVLAGALMIVAVWQFFLWLVRRSGVQAAEDFLPNPHV